MLLYVYKNVKYYLYVSMCDGTYLYIGGFVNQTIVLNARGERPRFYRLPSKWFGGVCQGMSQSFNIKPEYIRLMWFFSMLLSFGTTTAVYLLFWMVLPLENEISIYEQPKFLGVCHRLAKDFGWELAPIRLMAVGSIFLSLGFTILAYLALWLFFSFKD